MALYNRMQVRLTTATGLNTQRITFGKKICQKKTRERGRKKAGFDLNEMKHYSTYPQYNGT